MGFSSTRETVLFLERHGELQRIDREVDPNLEMAQIVRDTFANGGPALLFTRPKGCLFPMVANVFGTDRRIELLFSSALPALSALSELRANPLSLATNPAKWLSLSPSLLSAVPLPVMSAAVTECQTQLSLLPHLKCWPNDGGAFITLPQVYSEHPARPGFAASNLGMYRVQLSGNDYEPDRECGLHYQIHRGLGAHHAAAIEKNKRLPVSIFVGGPPAMALAAVMPLPENLPEIFFAGVLNQRNIRMHRRGSFAYSADADFCITGYVEPLQTKPEGPFGDHFGYYSERHPYPVLHVESVFHRKDAIWPFTVVGRPPQEDTLLGRFVHKITAPLVPQIMPGVIAVHAVDAAGVHPLLLAIGSERYVPFLVRKQPMELLTQASRILGEGQLSLAKYLWIAAHEDNPALTTNDVTRFFGHVLARVDFEHDLHFHTHTTIDTLDYTGDALNCGSKLVVAAVGEPRRALATSVSEGLSLPEGFASPHLAMPGVITLGARKFEHDPSAKERLVRDERLANQLAGIALVVLCDDPQFAARSIDNFVWVTFTRSDPASDIDGFGARIARKSWGCSGPMVIDARIKPGYPERLEPGDEVNLF
jgi:4-hydroxy-3-polyprenylbenzoate decarboxylase